jgi:thiol-disulfide isomerase/thioredoxin
MMKLLAAAALCLLPTLAHAEDELAGVDRKGPNFRLPVYNEKASGLSVFALERTVGPDATDKGAKVLVLSFMASFCGPCKKELPYLQALHQKYKDQGLRVVSVSIDQDEAGQKVVAELIEKNAVTFPVLRDRFGLVGRRWLGAKSPLPSLFFVRPDGTVSKVHRGYSQEASELLDRDVKQALGLPQ